MKTFRPFALGFMTRPVEFRRRFFLSLAVISFCPMGHRPGLLGRGIDEAPKRAEMEALGRQMEADGLDPVVVRQMLADPAAQNLMIEAEEKGREGYLASADAQDPAPRLDAAANDALRARLLDGRRGGPRLDLCGADLAGLDLSGFDLTEAWLDGADLRGTDLSDSSLHEADLARIHGDTATRYERVQRTRVRLNPRRTPP